MSAQGISLKSKPLVAGVLVLLAIVAGINVVVFKPGSRSKPGRQVRVQASQPLPADMGDFTRGGALPGTDLAAWGGHTNPVLSRDPFGRDQVAESVDAEEASPGTETEEISPALVCNAVLLGGSRPAAVINGKAYRLGDTVHDYQISAVGAVGVKLVGGPGPDLFLPVSAGDNQSRRGRIVNEMTRSEGLAGTSLVEHARGERK